MRRTLLISIWLVIATLAAYWPVRHAEFLNFDDNQYITHNPRVFHGLTKASMEWAFTTFHASNWHPLTWLSHMLDCQLFSDNAGAHHLVNVALHAANAVLLFLLLRRTTGALWRSALVAALFALHPLHVESVAWISERKDVLSTFFGLLALGAYAEYVSGVRCQVSGGEKMSSVEESHAHLTPHASRLYLLVVFFFACSLMSKPMLVTLPCIMLLLDVWPLRRVDLKTSLRKWAKVRPLFVEKIPFLVLSLASATITFCAQRHALVKMDAVPLEARVENACLAYGWYLFKAFWPTDLGAFYPYRPELSPTLALVAAVALIAASVLALWLARRAPYVFAGWFWYLGTLVPVIGLVQVGSQAVADRYSYVPLIGIFIIVVWGAAELLEGLKYRRVILGTAGTCLAAGCALVTFFQTLYWNNSITLFERALSVSPENNGLAHHNLGQALSLSGNQREAIFHFRESLRWWPDFAMAHLNWGNSVGIQGNLEEAMMHYREAIRSRPDCEEAYYNLGNACALQGKLGEAENNFRQAIRFKPDYAEALVKLANVLDMQGKIEEGRLNYDAALRARSDYEEAHYYLAGSLARQKQFEAAVTHFRAALKVKPLYSNALNDLAWILATETSPQVRNVPEALRLARRACELTHHSNALYLDTLAVALSEAGQFAEAVASTEKAVAVAKAAGQLEIAEQIEKHLPLYRDGRAYRALVGK